MEAMGTFLNAVLPDKELKTESSMVTPEARRCKHCKVIPNQKAWWKHMKARCDLWMNCDGSDKSLMVRTILENNPVAKELCKNCTSFVDMGPHIDEKMGKVWRKQNEKI